MTTAMQSLRDHWGLSNSEIGRALGVELSVIRRWNDGAELNAEEAARAEVLDRFLHQVRGCDIEEPSAWMSETLVWGYTATRWHIYCAGQLNLLIYDASQRNDDEHEQLLDLHDSDWRRTYWTSFKTVKAADGGLSVVGKSYDDVRAQMPEANA